MKGKDPAAVDLGRRGGIKRAQNLSKEELSEQGRNAVMARWEKVRKAKTVPAKKEKRG